MEQIENLRSINRNENGDYYIIFEIPNVKNHINPKAKPRNEVLIIGVPKKQFKNYLKTLIK